MIGLPAGWADENEWYWDTYLWQRRPRKSEAASLSAVGPAARSRVREERPKPRLSPNLGATITRIDSDASESLSTCRSLSSHGRGWSRPARESCS